MKKLTSSEIRQMWLDFFKSKGHNVEASASLVPQNDPTLLWTNAGVTPLKKYFDGSVVPNNPRITNAQKCIRTNDIENVGRTARHHTFFEMLGNFSIGDYFKKEAIAWAVELLFDEKWFGFKKEKLYMTYYTKDVEARDIWIQNGIDESHLIPLDGNYWEIGEGPCGPDTEMFYDRGEKYDKRGKELIAEDIENDRFIEIWNIVFSQFNSKNGIKRENYEELPSKNIDTGCGLERLCCVMQEVDTNYDTDLFIPIIKKTSEISGVEYKGQMAFKVIADHVRTVTFAVADGAIFSNDGRGYVMRRVLRRASKYAKGLGINYPFMKDLVDVVIDIMKSYYPYLVSKRDIIKQIITKEEEKFLATLSTGEKRFELISLDSKNGIISGPDAFMLYDTYGFPIELTIEYAEDKKMTVDMVGFKSEMEEQKNRARQSRKKYQSMKDQNEEYMNFFEKSEFVGYETTESVAKVIKVFEEGIVLDKTPFYAFSGGQLADSGIIDGIEVTDVIKLPNGQHLHILESNSFKVGDIVNAIVDSSARELTCKNHTSAHLLQKALQVVLGDHVHQQGSQVSPTYVRFDFNNYNALTDEELVKIEDLVNEFINASYPVITHIIPIDEAKQMGAMALFGEKYGDIVRVVDSTVSKEFCGGTHVTNTSMIDKFMITSYESIGSGTFRITGSTSKEAFCEVKNSTLNIERDIESIVSKANNLLKEAACDNIDLEFNYNEYSTDKVGYRYIIAKRLEKEAASKALHEVEKTYQQKKSQNVLSSLAKYKDSITKNSLIITDMDFDASLLKETAIALLNNFNLDLVFILNNNNEKLILVCATSAKYNANEIIKSISKSCGASGGGKPNLAQAGGKAIPNLDALINEIKDMIK